MIISADSLGFGYGREPFMQGLSLGIPAGSICAVLGPNGSGKTTLLLLFLGLLMPKSGSVTVAGIDTTAGRERLKRYIGLVPQDESIPFALSVFEYVLLGRAPHLGLLQQPGSEDRAVAMAALEQVGIAHLKHRPVTALSGGERQLCMVARVIVQDPRILLMDEPTSHLDLANTRRILAMMRLLKSSGKTVVFSTHDPNAATAVADQVVLLHQGSLMSVGRPKDVLNDHTLSAVYGVPVEVLTVDGRPWVMVD
ncbi:MAG: ABC transporter ATP-binding protein [Syntrophaceae bacterium]